jgi:hypothetical protein
VGAGRGSGDAEDYVLGNPHRVGVLDTVRYVKTGACSTREKHPNA